MAKQLVEARRRSGDLFPLGRPMPPDQVIGRAAAIRDLAQGLSDGTHAVVPGPRRSGKSTACQAALREASRNDVLPIELDLYAVETEDEFLTELRDATAAAAASVGRTPVLGRLPVRLARIGLAELPFADDLKPLFEGIFAGPLRSDAILRLPQELARIRRKRVGLFVDEAQRIHGFPEQFRRELHQAFRRSDRVTLLLTGSDASMMDGLLSEPFSPVAGLIGHQQDLPPITEAEWVEGLTSLFGVDGCRLEQRALKIIIHAGEAVGVTAVHSIISIAHHVHSLSKLEDTQFIDEDLAVRGYERAEPDLRRLEGSS